MTHILIPREPSPALLRPFIGCQPQELPVAYAAMVRIAEVQHARDGRQCLAQIEEPAQPVAEICSASHDDAEFGERAIKPLCDISGFEYGTPLYAGAAPAAVAPQAERQWICPTRTVADLVNNLLTMDQALPIYGAQYIERDGRRCAIAVPPTVSRERVKDGRWIGQGEELNAAVVWTRAEQPAGVAGPALDVRAIAAAVCQRVAELPDRDSPEDWPEAMLVTGQELIDAVADEIEQALAVAAPALEAPAAPESAPWCPDVCPITGRPFFMWIEHWQTGKPVPTYGGPYDSYTIPVKDSDGSFECERYDHDEGGWLTEGAGWHCLGVKLVDDQSFVVDPSNPRYNEIEAFAAAAPQAPAAAVDPVPVDPADALRWGANVAETLLRIGESIGFGRAQQILGEQWEAKHDCAPRGRMGVTVKDARSAAPQAPAAPVVPAATMFHDAGAIAQCTCGRYTLDRNSLSPRDDRRPVCECGTNHGWSGSFKKPGADSKWHGPAPAQEAAPAAPVGEYTLVDEGGPVELAGAQAQYSIERADGSTAAWILGDGSAVAELMAALRMPVSGPCASAPAAPAVDAETVKKAARYDWLRRSNVANGTVLAEHFGGSRMQDFDAVIDAKIAAQAAAKGEHAS